MTVITKADGAREFKATEDGQYVILIERTKTKGERAYQEDRVLVTREEIRRLAEIFK